MGDPKPQQPQQVRLRRPNNATKADISPVVWTHSDHIPVAHSPEPRALSSVWSVRPRLITGSRFHEASSENSRTQDVPTRNELPTSARAAPHERRLTHVRKGAHTHTHPHPHTHTETHAHIHTHTHIHPHTPNGQTRTDRHTCTSTRVHSRAQRNTHTHTHARIHAYIRTLSHARSPTISLIEGRSSCFVRVGASEEASGQVTRIPTLT